MDDTNHKPALSVSSASVPPRTATGSSAGSRFGSCETIDLLRSKSQMVMPNGMLIPRYNRLPPWDARCTAPPALEPRAAIGTALKDSDVGAPIGADPIHCSSGAAADMKAAATVRDPRTRCPPQAVDESV